ncbi:MAG: maleylpyruvate isomerase family mycothiol-dependent enzyme [Actinomycetes bacterium]
MSQTLLSLDRYLELLQQDSEALAHVLERAEPALPVRTCPGWTLADLGYHVGEVHRFWHWIVREGIQEVTDANSPNAARPADDELARWLREGLADLLPLLRSVDPQAPAWSWHAPQSDMAFIQRRLPHETSVHRWDAQDAAHAAGAAPPAPLARDLAVDGVAEFFLLGSRERHEIETRMGLRATDTGDVWTASVTNGEWQLVAGIADAPVVLSGTASALLLTLWRRMSPAGRGEVGVDVAGDPALARAFLALADLD